MALRATSPARRWLDHPVMGPALRRHLGDGPLLQVLDSQELGPTLGAFPMSRICRFPGSPLSEDDLAQLLGEGGA